MNAITGIPSLGSVTDYEERRALQAVIAGKQADISSLTDNFFRRTIIAVNQGSVIPDPNNIKNEETKRIMKQIKIKLEA